MDTKELAAVLDQQDGVISRRQVLACGGADLDIERLVRRRSWARVHAGVFVNHTGALTWQQRAWAAVLLHWPAALGGRSALRAHGLDGSADDAPIELVVARHRRVTDPPGVRTTRISGFDDAVLANLNPPRVRVEHASITVASRAATDDKRVAALGQACQRRRTTATRLLAEAKRRTRAPGRRLILEVLGDIAQGANSALERRYLIDVERAHGLPCGTRQRRVVNGKRTAYRDVDYESYDTLVELDGQLGHDGTEERWDDLDRDVDAAVAGKLTVRAGWRQILSPCRLAIAIGRILVARGWESWLVPCGPRCPVATVEDPRRSRPEILH